MSLDLDKATDEELMAAYQQGNPGAFDVLYGRHSAKVFSFLRARVREQSLVDDLFQATFLKLHHARSRYNRAFPFIPWLFTVCRSVLIDSMRKAERTPEDQDEIALQNAVALDEPVSGSLAGIPELSSLSPDQRRAVELRFGEDFSFEEIAANLGTSTSNARQLVSRAVRSLKSLSKKDRDGK